jgi:hypothetical protein
VAEGIRASVGVAGRPLGDGVRAAVLAAVAPPSTAAAAPAEGRCPPAEAAVPALFAPSAAQPAVSMIAPSNTAAVVSESDHRARRRLPFRLLFRPNITSILPACGSLRTGDARPRGRITHFGFRIFRYRGLAVVSPRL